MSVFNPGDLRKFDSEDPPKLDGKEILVIQVHANQVGPAMSVWTSEWWKTAPKVHQQAVLKETIQTIFMIAQQLGLAEDG